MVTNLLNEKLMGKLESIQLVDSQLSPEKNIESWSYCSDGSCRGDCVGGCDGTPAGGF